MTNSSALFDEIAASFQFPDYFGENWAALEECLCDLEWLSGGSYVLGIQDSARVLTAEQDKLAVFCDLLVRTCESWARPVSDGQYG